MLKIIFDLDGVLLDTYSVYLEYLVKNHGINKIPDYDFVEKSLNGSDHNKMFDDLLQPDNCENLKEIKPFCKLFFNCAFNGNKLWIVTSRKNKIRQDGAIIWLDKTFPDLKRGIDYELAFRDREEKPDFAISNQVDLAIDDCPETAIAYAERGIRVLVPLYPYNENVDYPKGVRTIKIDKED